MPGLRQKATLPDRPSAVTETPPSFVELPVNSALIRGYHAPMNSSTLPLADLRAAAARLCHDVGGVRLVVLFGSVARGHAAPLSDVDIGVLGAGFWPGLEIGSELARLCAREPHVVELDLAPELLRYEIARDGIPLFESEADVWPRFRAEAIVRYLDFKPTLDLCVAGARQHLLSETQNG